MKNLFLFVLLLLAELMYGQLSGTLKGKILDENEKNYPVAYANIVVYKGTGENLELTDGSSSDENGEYYIPNIPVGSYILEMTYIDFSIPLRIIGVQIRANDVTPLDIKYPILSEEQKGQQLIVIELPVERRIINITDDSNVKTITIEDIKEREEYRANTEAKPKK
jgi:Carboxypeptidase regulatory-like domain